MKRVLRFLDCILPSVLGLTSEIYTKCNATKWAFFVLQYSYLFNHDIIFQVTRMTTEPTKQLNLKAQFSSTIYKAWFCSAWSLRNVRSDLLDARYFRVKSRSIRSDLEAYRVARGRLPSLPPFTLHPLSRLVLWLVEGLILWLSHKRPRLARTFGLST